MPTGKADISLGEGNLYIQDPDGNWQELGRVRELRVGMSPEIHKVVKKGCRFLKCSYDIDHRMVDACHHPSNTPPHESWGTCDPMSCPLARE